jgi:hypothetical protein
MARCPVGGWWLDSVGTVRDPKAENILTKTNEPSDPTKVQGLLVKPTNYQILDKDTAPRSYNIHQRRVSFKPSRYSAVSILQALIFSRLRFVQDDEFYSGLLLGKVQKSVKCVPLCAKVHYCTFCNPSLCTTVHCYVT